MKFKEFTLLTWMNSLAFLEFVYNSVLQKNTFLGAKHFFSVGVWSFVTFSQNTFVKFCGYFAGC